MKVFYKFVFCLFWILAITCVDGFFSCGVFAKETGARFLDVLKNKSDVHGMPVITTSTLGALYRRYSKIDAAQNEVLWTDVEVGIIAHTSKDNLADVIERAKHNLAVIQKLGVSPYLKGSVQLSYAGVPLLFVQEIFSQNCLIELEMTDVFAKGNMFLLTSEDISVENSCTLLAWSFAANNYRFKSSPQRKELVLLVKE